MNSGICFVIISVEHLSINSALRNFQDPGPRFVLLLSKDSDRLIAECSEKILATIIAFSVADSMLFEIKSAIHFLRWIIPRKCLLIWMFAAPGINKIVSSY